MKSGGCIWLQGLEGPRRPGPCGNAITHGFHGLRSECHSISGHNFGFSFPRFSNLSKCRSQATLLGLDAVLSVGAFHQTNNTKKAADTATNLLRIFACHSYLYFTN
jgi:hypothetical protein